MYYWVMKKKCDYKKRNKEKVYIVVAGECSGQVYKVVWKEDARMEDKRVRMTWLVSGVSNVLT